MSSVRKTSTDRIVAINAHVTLSESELYCAEIARFVFRLPILGPFSFFVVHSVVRPYTLLHTRIIKGRKTSKRRCAKNVLFDIDGKS